MISIVLIDKENKFDVSEYLNILGTLSCEVETIYCSSKVANYQGFKNYTYNLHENTEKIINAVVRKCAGSSLVVVRNIDRLKFLKNMISNYKKSDQIICLKRNLGKFKSFLYSIADNTAGKIYLHKLKPIDYGMIMYGEVATRVLKNINSPSVLMCTNNFEGLNYVYIDGGKKYKFSYNKKLSATKTLLPIIISVLMIVLNLAIGFKLFVTINILYYLVAIFSLFLGIMFGLGWVVRSVLGDNITEKAELKLDDIDEKNIT